MGINESGKSNLLSALSLLDMRSPIRREDIRFALPSEDPIQESKVTFYFQIQNEDLEALTDSIESEILSEESDKPLFPDKRIKTLTDLIKAHNQFIYRVNLLAKDKSDARKFLYYTTTSEYPVLPKWKQPSEACPTDYIISINSVNYKLKDYFLIDSSMSTGIPPEYLKDVVFQDIYQKVMLLCIKYVEENIPKVLIWTYREDFLLPSSVNIETFSTNPETCVPLKNMFELSGFTNIQETISNARKSSNRNTFGNLLSNVAAKTTSHFKNVWKEYKDIKFSLEPDGDNIIPGVREKNTFDFAQRSDGFKRFVSFLLHISVNVETKKLTNSLLLIDEPDISLHPPGVKDLRDRLINISQENDIVFSTHSIFMIDPESIHRHLIVKKINEVTEFETAGDSNIRDEELLFNALGYSVFSILQQKNIIFEGWTDKLLFKTAIGKLPKEHERLKQLKQLGTCHVKGVSQVKAVTPLIELANRECLIISDSDTPARTNQDKYLENKGYGVWKRYDELLENLEDDQVLTAEDFIKESVVIREIKNLEDRNPQLVKFDKATLPKIDRVSAIDTWLKTNQISANNRKKFTEEIKQGIFEKIKSSEIEDNYYQLLSNLNLLVFPNS